MIEPRVVLYTCLFGDYDLTPPNPGQECPRYLITDRDVAAPGWLVLRPALPQDLNPRRRSRAPKMQPHLFLPPHDISIYADANIRFKRDVSRDVLEHLAHADVAVHAHPNPESKSVRDEADKVIRLGLDQPGIVREQVSRHDREGFPDALPLTENCFMIRRDGGLTRLLGRLWWSEYCLGSQRDQLSLNYSCWLAGVAPAIIPGNSRDNNMYYQVDHLGSRRIVEEGASLG